MGVGKARKLFFRTDIYKPGQELSLTHDQPDLGDAVNVLRGDAAMQQVSSQLLDQLAVVGRKRSVCGITHVQHSFPMGFLWIRLVSF